MNGQLVFTINHNYITLYKEREVIKKNIPEEEAVDALIELIKLNKDWIDKNQCLW